MKRVDRVGLHGDRFAFLAAVMVEAPQVLEDLTRLLKIGGWVVQPPARSGFAGCASAQSEALVGWAQRWNLASTEGADLVGAWILDAACRTLQMWQRSCSRIAPADLPARGWSYTTGGRGGTRPLPVATAERPKALYASKQTGHAPPRARELREMGEAVAELVTFSNHHVRAFARWQVLKEPVAMVAERWAKLENRSEAPSTSTVHGRCVAMAKQLGLPRAKRPAGRRRPAG